MAREFLTALPGTDGDVPLEGIRDDIAAVLRIDRERVRCVGFHDAGRREEWPEYVSSLRIDVEGLNVGWRERSEYRLLLRWLVETLDPRLRGECHLYINGEHDGA